MQACKNVTAYGFGLDNNAGKRQEYHYFHLQSPAHSKKKNSMNPTHSFDLEKLLLRQMSEEGLIQLCMSQPGDQRLRRDCGLVESSARRNQRETEAFDFGVLEGGRAG